MTAVHLNISPLFILSSSLFSFITKKGKESSSGACRLDDHLDFFPSWYWIFARCRSSKDGFGFVCYLATRIKTCLTTRSFGCEVLVVLAPIIISRFRRQLRERTGFFLSLFNHRLSPKEYKRLLSATFYQSVSVQGICVLDSFAHFLETKAAAAAAAAPNIFRHNYFGSVFFLREKVFELSQSTSKASHPY